MQLAVGEMSGDGPGVYGQAMGAGCWLLFAMGVDG